MLYLGFEFVAGWICKISSQSMEWSDYSATKSWWTKSRCKYEKCRMKK